MTDHPIRTEIASPVAAPVVEFSHVSKTFFDPKAKSRTLALNDISFAARRGRITGLIGPDAAGKTTLMRILAGLMVPDSGAVTVLGRDAVRQFLEVQSHLAYMPQRFGLYEDLTTQENLDLYADLQGLPPAERPDRYEELMHMTNLGAFTRRLAGQLSGGMKQKLGLACALVRFPELLVLDEPTVGVDPLSRRELWAIINRLVSEEGVSVILSTAYLDEAEKCHDIILIHEGNILGAGTPQDFKSKVAGRTYAASIAGIPKRRFEAQLAQRKDIIDAAIQGDSVRLVTSQPLPPSIQDLFPQVSLTPVPPRFEDSFVDILRGKRPTSPAAAHPDFDVPSPPQQGTSKQTVIEVTDLSRRFGDFYAVDGVSFEVDRGEIFGLLGANGAGKSTTFRMLCGLLPITAGHARVAGVDLRHAPAKARLRIGYMSQKFSLYGDLSVRQNLQFFSSVYGLAGKQRKERIEWALDQFNLTAHAEVNSISLPLGYKQRLALACSLMHQPEILFLDEPTSGVDPLARRQFWSRINALAQAGVTVMVTTHFMDEAEYCDRLAIMAAGKILTIGAPADIRRSARTETNPEPTIEDAFVHLIEQYEPDRKAS